MAMEIPKAEKVYTTTYENFRGVDFTNDPSNVWYRRSPDAVNMLPDEAGNPFKRTGWKIEVSSSDIAGLYASDNSKTAPSEITIRKCYYFELAGEDHIVIFTDYGVFIYRSGELLSSKSMSNTNVISYDDDMINSYDRAFFFEGGGKSAFYIYGGFKIWEYAYNDTNGFTWGEVEPYIPRVNIGVDARHESGTSYETVNMLSDYICEEFQDNAYLSVTSTTANPNTISVSVDDTEFIAMVDGAGSYQFSYTEADHSWLLGGDQVLISNYGITLSGSAPADGNTITVVLSPQNRINLPKVITSADGMSVWVSAQGQFDTPLQIITTGSATSGKVLLKKDNNDNFSHLEFAQSYSPIVEGEDCIKVVYPRNAVTPTHYNVPADPEQYIEINVGA